MKEPCGVVNENLQGKSDASRTNRQVVHQRKVGVSQKGLEKAGYLKERAVF